MKTLNILIVVGLFFSLPTFAKRMVDVSADQFMKEGIPYCTRKITRGCVKSSESSTGKYYFAPKYTVKSAKNSKVKKKTVASLSKKNKKNSLGKSSKVTAYSKTKQGKRDLASLLEKKLKSHKKKKSK